ncbi:DUF4190 domain-containing protein [Microbacterium sp. NPDC076895]|uniref:DUF4190 domain-containing protein n=1 Tax=Microbacterium sp. NPDC076895 TaxID=3154957 RepID=UPI00341CF51C
MTLPPPPPSNPSGSQPSRLPPPPSAPSQPYGSNASTGRTPPPPVAGNPNGGPPPGKKRATLAVVYGVIGLVPGCGLILAILAIVMGVSSQKASRAAGLNPYGTAKAGIVLGWIGLGITVIYLIIALVSSIR